MTNLKNDGLYYEILRSDPPEKRPTATKEFKAARNMVIHSAYLALCDYLRHSSDNRRLVLAN